MRQRIPLSLPWLIVLLLFALLLLLVSLGHWRAAAVGPQVQVPMFYDAHYLFPRPWTQAQEAPGVPDPAPVAALYGPNVLSQSFVAGADRLSLVRVWLAGPPGSEVLVELHDGGDLLLSGVVVLTEANGRFYNLTFPPLSHRQGHRFTLSLRAPQAGVEAPVISRAVGGDRLGGAVHLNEYSRPGNLELYTYANGRPGRWWLQAIGEQILPGLFALRVQQYKPPIFKGSTFPLLLAATLGLTALFLLLARPSATSLSQAAAWAVAGLLLAFMLWQIAGQRLLLPPLLPSVPLTPAEPGTVVANHLSASERLVHDFSLTLWTGRRLPEERLVTTDWVDVRPAIRVPAASSLSYALTMPLNGRFQTRLAVDGPGELRFSLQWAGQEIAVQQAAAADGLIWLEADLSPWAGQEGHLHMVTEPLDGQPDGLWLSPQLAADHEWLLSPTAAQTWQPAHFLFDHQVELVGYHLTPGAVPGDLVELHLYWRALRPIAAPVVVFVHLLDNNDQIIAQQDGPPVAGTYPLTIWPPEQIVVDRRWLHIPETAAAGDYRLAVGLYHPGNLARWPVTAAGEIEPLPDGRIFLDQPFIINP
jgi:hypothetical protein